MTEKRYTSSMQSDETIQLGVTVEDRKTACEGYEDKQNVKGDPAFRDPTPGGRFFSVCKIPPVVWWVLKPSMIILVVRSSWWHVEVFFSKPVLEVGDDLVGVRKGLDSGKKDFLKEFGDAGDEADWAIV
ncbi:hypothetical protein TNCV_3160071 [Trichonephila clavipes]|nr:hypothetical protein TNCV_3160071 [Trichonephila clavipes]